MSDKFTLDVLVDYVRDKGFQINNLFELDDGRWQANLRCTERDTGKEKFYEFGHGATHKEALMNALEKAI